MHSCVCVCACVCVRVRVPVRVRVQTDLAQSRSASRDMVMLVRFCCRMKMLRHIFLMPDSLILLKY